MASFHRAVCSRLKFATIPEARCAKVLELPGVSSRCPQKDYQACQGSWILLPGFDTLPRPLLIGAMLSQCMLASSGKRCLHKLSILHVRTGM